MDKYFRSKLPYIISLAHTKALRINKVNTLSKERNWQNSSLTA